MPNRSNKNSEEIVRKLTRADDRRFIVFVHVQRSYLHALITRNFLSYYFGYLIKISVKPPLSFLHIKLKRHVFSSKKTSKT